LAPASTETLTILANQFRSAHRMYAMTNPIQRYTWGSHTELARLQRRAPPGEPEAELWMGAHPAAPSVLRDGTSDHGAVSLLEWIVQDPEGMLGADTLSEFGGRLPFLLKILAIESPLSLQVHPDSRQAEQGFADDEARGVPLDAPDRSYWDAAAKPEMLCAVTEVEALCGFRDPIRSAVLLQRLGIDPLVGMARRLTEGPAPEAIREVLARLLAWPEDDRPLLVEAVAKAAHRYAGGTGGGTGTSPASGIADGEAASAYAWVTRLAELYPADPGVVCALLLNHVRLQPGEALVLLAGNLHAYLHGVGVEIMGNSDNVLRAGLTPKHVGVPRLLGILQTAPTTPQVVTAEPDPNGEEVYRTDVREFRLSRLRLQNEDTVMLQLRGPEILLCLEGEVSAQSGIHRVLLRPGESAFIPASAPPVAVAGPGALYRATPGLSST
jgi:mannose-6-phosphate isomerase